MANDRMGEEYLNAVPSLKPFRTQGGRDCWEKADVVKETLEEGGDPDQGGEDYAVTLAEIQAPQDVHGQMTSDISQVQPEQDGSEKTGSPNPSWKTENPSPSDKTGNPSPYSSGKTGNPSPYASGKTGNPSPYASGKMGNPSSYASGKTGNPSPYASGKTGNPSPSGKTGPGPLKYKSRSGQTQ